MPQAPYNPPFRVAYHLEIDLSKVDIILGALCRKKIYFKITKSVKGFIRFVQRIFGSILQLSINF